MKDYQLIAILIAIFYLAIFAVGIYLLVLIIKSLKKYIGSKEVRQEKEVIIKSLSEALRENRIRCTMTQEFVAEALGVSRQAVSKWENGTSEPSTSNLIALAKLYGISAEDLIRGIHSKSSQDKDINLTKGDEK
ncbi:MAG: helix-turn-helix transcriptional regulator [Erysipelotrichaceae bacterium]|nr:helix-turn-helix transcriptional regulator [Erysipelotrichaceae bacterium]